MKRILVTTTLSMLVSIAQAETIVDVTKIAGKTKDQVSTYLGKPSSCGKSKYGKKCQYQRGETEIVFINGKADWITVEGIDHIPFSKSALSAIGLEESLPSFSNNFSLRWSSIQGLMEVSIFKGASKCDYAYVKVKTK